MSRSNEPQSGWNLPPGCFESDIDEAFGEPTTCGDCSHLVEGCCDYGICELEFAEAFDEEAPQSAWKAARWALGWIVNSYKDMQEDVCDRFDG